MAERIPVLIVAGFLGSGKTTLLNHLLRAAGDTRIGVVVNDFGAVNIDAMLVAGQVDAMVSLGNGCVCCAVDLGELDEMFTRLTESRHAVDVIVVEASGLAEPRNLVRMVIGSANPRLRYGGLVEVVDAEQFPETSARHPELLTHLRLADLVVLNKIDRALEADAVRARIAETVGQVPIHATTHGRVAPGLLFDEPVRRAVDGPEQLSFDALLAEPCAAEPHPHLHDGYRSIAFHTERPLDPRALVAFLEDPPDGLFRAKGVAAVAVAGERRKWTFHLVGRHVAVEPVAWARGERRATDIVLIGTGLDEAALRARLAAAEHSAAEPLGADALLGLWRYTPEPA
ncbi:CobW family GTP-binding protein [Nocardia asteroides]|uniref:CobW family GTP-binding protein n=1 Tax=Nocardia asteroides TaxID=1824 RepID=UPI001E2828C5|nr:CobW family GTP-binding protein [Nocardia asteroides]UGT63881.1 GTP-binding protein [Nocardia asteroides]